MSQFSVLKLLKLESLNLVYIWTMSCSIVGLRIELDRFLSELWPFVSLSHFINRSSCLRILLHFSRDFDETLQLLFP